MTVLWARVDARSPQRRELTRALLDWAAAVRRDPEAVGAHLAEDIEEPGVYFLASEWRDRHALEVHLASPDFGVLLGALQVLGQRSQIEVMGCTEGAEGAAALIRRLRSRAPSTPQSGLPELPQ